MESSLSASAYFRVVQETIGNVVKALELRAKGQSSVDDRDHATPTKEDMEEILDGKQQARKRLPLPDSDVRHFVQYFTPFCRPSHMCFLSI